MGVVDLDAATAMMQSPEEGQEQASGKGFLDLPDEILLQILTCWSSANSSASEHHVPRLTCSC